MGKSVQQRSLVGPELGTLQFMVHALNPEATRAPLGRHKPAASAFYQRTRYFRTQWLLYRQFICRQNKPQRCFNCHSCYTAMQKMNWTYTSGTLNGKNNSTLLFVVFPFWVYATTEEGETTADCSLPLLWLPAPEQQPLHRSSTSMCCNSVFQPMKLDLHFQT